MREPEEIIKSLKNDGLIITARGVITLGDGFKPEEKEKINELRESLEDKGGDGSVG